MSFLPLHCSGSGLLSPEWLYPQNHIIKAHKKVSQSMNLVYGYGNLQAIYRWQQLSRQLADINILAHPDAMLTTSGVSSAIETITRAMCQSGDYVLVDDPTWFWIIGCLQQLGLNNIGVNRNSHMLILLAVATDFRELSSETVYYQQRTA